MGVQKARDERNFQDCWVFFFRTRPPEWRDLGSFGAVQLQKKEI